MLFDDREAEVPTLIDSSTGTWKYTHILGLANSTTGSCVILRAELATRRLAVIEYRYRTELDDEDDNFQQMMDHSEMLKSIKHGFACWMDGQLGGYTLCEELEATPSIPCEFPVVRAVGSILSFFGLMSGIDFDAHIDSVIAQLTGSLPQPPICQVIRDVELTLNPSRTLAELADSASFSIPSEVISLATMQSRRLSKADTLMLTLYFVNEPITLSEALKLGAQLGLLAGTPAGRVLTSSKDHALYTRDLAQFNSAIKEGNSVKQYGEVYAGKKRVRMVCRKTQHRTSEGRLPRYAKSTVSRAVKGVGPFGLEWHLVELTDLGRREAAQKLGLLEKAGHADDATLANPRQLVLRLLDEAGGELSEPDLIALWESQPTDSPTAVANRSTCRHRLRFWSTVSRWDEQLLERSSRDGVNYYRLYGANTAPLDLIIAPAPLSQLALRVKQMFELSQLHQVCELLTLFNLGAQPVTLGDLQLAIDALVEHELLISMDRNSVDFSLRFYYYSARRPDFELFYDKLNARYRTMEMLGWGLSISRRLARIAYDCGAISSITGLFSTFTINEDTLAVKVDHCLAMPWLGNGLFACCDLPKGTELPVHGKTAISQPGDNRFLPYGFSFINSFKQRVEIDTKPEDTVTCLAGYVNDPRNTGYKANCEQQFCRREERIYLTLTREVKQGEQLFWSYGEQYWEAYDNSGPAGARAMPSLMDMPISDFEAELRSLVPAEINTNYLGLPIALNSAWMKNIPFELTMS